MLVWTLSLRSKLQVFRRANNLAAEAADRFNIEGRPQYKDSTQSDFTFQYNAEVMALVEKIRVDIQSKEPGSIWADLGNGRFADTVWNLATSAWNGVKKILMGGR